MEAYLTVETGQHVGSSYTLRAGETLVLGSDPGAQVRLRDAGIAPQQAALRLDPQQGLQVVDLAGGTLLNGRPLAQRTPTPTGSGDALTLGECELLVELVGVEAVAQAAPERSLAERFPSPDYEVLRQLGQGGMGSVFEARRRADGLAVAIKVLNERVEPSSVEHQRFVVEGRAGNKVQSSHVVQIYDVGVLPSGQAFIAMELVPGPSVEQRLAAGPITIGDALLIGEHVALALAAAAAAGVVHRDVKPANVLLHPQGIAKLTDFGIAKDLDSTMKSLTASGVGLGTLGYMAPEQLEAKYVDTGADIYGLGATLFHLLTGRAPFQPQSAEQIPLMLETQAPSVRELRPDAPEPLAALIAEMLAQEPWDRPASAAEVAQRLRGLRGA